MKLHEYKNAFEGAVAATAQHFNISEVFIEKDYWVTYALKQIFQNENTKDIAIFKGGTSLSKCYKIINRFSEDIDIIVAQEPDETGTSLKKKLKLITDTVDGFLSPVPNHPLENKKGKIRKLVYEYHKIGARRSFGEINDHIVVEASVLGNPDPHKKAFVHSMIAQFIGTTNNHDLIKTYELEPFEVKVLSLERTFCEKIISLVRFSYTKNPLADLSGKVRHTYDLFQLLQQPEILKFLNSNSFEDMLNQVGEDDNKAIPNDKAWISLHPADSLFFSRTNEVWETMRKSYQSNFKEMVFSDLPDEKKVLAASIKIGNRLKEIQWRITE